MYFFSVVSDGKVPVFLALKVTVATLLGILCLGVHISAKIGGVAAVVWNGALVPKYLLPSPVQKLVPFQPVWTLGHVPGSVSQEFGRLLKQAIAFLVEQVNWIKDSCVEDSSSSCTLKKFGII